MRVVSSAQLSTVPGSAANQELSPYLSRAAFTVPEWLIPSAWLQHGPFGFWLVEAIRPRSIVELGAYRGFSYLTFCQAVQQLGLETSCYAIDTWEGDEHSGFYGEEILAPLQTYHDGRYNGFSRLIRSTFDEAVDYFPDGSIDLLHIDGRHFYEDVKHDFETWVPKLSDRAIVLFHDTNVRERSFGVWRFWEELRQRYPSFEFVHGYGLGVLAINADAIPEATRVLFGSSEAQRVQIRDVYARLGAALTDRLAVSELREESVASRRKLVELDNAVEREARLIHSLERSRKEQEDLRERARAQRETLRAEQEALREKVRAAAAEASRLHAEIARLQAHIHHIRLSASWRLTGPLRVLARRLPMIGRTGRRAYKVLRLSLTCQLGTHLQAKRQAKYDLDRMARSGLFDSAWYLERYPDVAAGGIDPLTHYATVGWREGRDPNRFFDTNWYLAQHPELRHAGTPPLLDYIEAAARGEWRNPHSQFDAAWYADQNFEGGASAPDPLLYHLQTGAGLGLATNFAAAFRKRVFGSGLFEPEWYLERNPDVKLSGSLPLAHYVTAGWREEREPNRFFDTTWYLEQHPELRGTGVPALIDYMDAAARGEPRNPHPYFDVAWYLEQNHDARASELDPLAHYLVWGRKQGRETCAARVEERRRIRQQVLGAAAPVAPRSVAIGVVTYNNDPSELRRCMASARIALREAGLLNRGRLLLIDNGQPTPEALLAEYGARRVESSGNIGFGAGHNRLMAEVFGGDGDAKDLPADCYIAANPDGAFHPDCIRALVQMSQVAADTALIEGIQFPEEHPKIYDWADFETPWASGACLMVPRAIYDAVGGFDDRFFMYCEDVDLSWRARAAGFSVKTCPRAFYFHPVIDRPYDSRVHQRFLTSGLILARKWGSNAFEERLLSEFERHCLSVPNLPEIAPVAGGEVTDFEHMFSFAQTRW